MKKIDDFDMFDYNRILEPLCRKLTHHKHRKLIGYDKSFEDNGYKYPNRHDFWYKCNICGFVFYNHKISKEDLERIKNEGNDIL